MWQHLRWNNYGSECTGALPAAANARESGNRTGRHMFGAHALAKALSGLGAQMSLGYRLQILDR